MRSSWFSTLVSLALSLIILVACTPSLITAQSDNCHACIQRTIPTVKECTSINPTQQALLDDLIHGKKLPDYTSSYSSLATKDPVTFACLEGLMWDSVHYKAQLWSKCLDPAAACPWTEMMQYMTIITRMAAVYGAKNPPVS
ncbi:hypothetical protein BGZ94_004007 [Podila epigama]|nr:hypothetical protein BGZ94_004007 [Podila epigama]